MSKYGRQMNDDDEVKEVILLEDVYDVMDIYID